MKPCTHGAQCLQHSAPKKAIIKPEIWLFISIFALLTGCFVQTLLLAFDCDKLQSIILGAFAIIIFFFIAIYIETRTN